MPFYEFKCAKCSKQEEKYFSFQEKHELKCVKCKKEMNKVIQATPAVFRGGGWGGQP
jgi:Zn finger protein HypA/HybF involved in hydrogenase expression